MTHFVGGKHLIREGVAQHAEHGGIVGRRRQPAALLLGERARVGGSVPLIVQVVLNVDPDAVGAVVGVEKRAGVALCPGVLTVGVVGHQILVERGLGRVVAVDQTVDRVGQVRRRERLFVLFARAGALDDVAVGFPALVIDFDALLDLFVDRVSVGVDAVCLRHVEGRVKKGDLAQHGEFGGVPFLLGHPLGLTRVHRREIGAEELVLHLVPAEGRDRGRLFLRRGDLGILVLAAGGKRKDPREDRGERYQRDQNPACFLHIGSPVGRFSLLL